MQKIEEINDRDIVRSCLDYSVKLKYKKYKCKWIRRLVL
jgi:hypothetical protein